MDDSHDGFVMFFDGEFGRMLDLFADTELEASKSSLEVMENILKLV
jgi:hypothetical protein